MLILTRARETQGWSRQELARRSRLTPGEVGKIEHARLVPYPSQLQRLAGALGWSGDPSELLAEIPDAPTE
jgi:ribosome-binding protein aMBF1 (putative translation factor)